MKTGKYLFLFVLFLINLIAFVNVLQNMTLEQATIQIFVIFAYLIIAALVLYGLGNNRRWSMAGGAVLFFAHLVNIAFIFRMVRTTSVFVIVVVSIIGFLYCMRSLERTPRKVEEKVVIPQEPVVIEKYGAQRSSQKRTSKRKPGRPKGSKSKKVKRSSAKRASKVGRPKKASRRSSKRSSSKTAAKSSSRKSSKKTVRVSSRKRSSRK